MPRSQRRATPTSRPPRAARGRGTWTASSLGSARRSASTRRRRHKAHLIRLVLQPSQARLHALRSAVHALRSAVHELPLAVHALPLARGPKPPTGLLRRLHAQLLKMPSPMASSRLSGRTGALTARSSGGLTARSELKPQTIGNAMLTPRGQKDTDERGDRTRAAKDAPPSARSRGRGQARGSEDESVPADVPSKVVTV